MTLRFSWYDLPPGVIPLHRVDETWNGFHTDTIYTADGLADAEDIAASFVESGHGARIYVLTDPPHRVDFSAHGHTGTDGWALVEDRPQEA